MQRFPLFRGSRDTRRHDGRDYETVSFADLRRMCREPAAEPKLHASAFIASTYIGHLARNHEEQRKRGHFHAFIADVDTGSPTLAEVETAVVRCLGDCARLIYSSSSATAEQRKWRVIVPVRDPIAGSAYADVQAAFFDALLHHGIACDYALARTGQPVFLPNVPPDRRGPDGAPLFYEYVVREIGGLRAVPEAILAAAAETARRAEEARRVAAEVARRRAEERQKQREHTGMLSPIEQFNADHDLTALLLEHGWEPRGHDCFASPYSQSKGPSVYVYGQRAISFTSSDVGQIGRISANGWATYDPWDVFVARVYGGNEAIALIEYRERSGYDQRILQAIIGKWGRP
jgi:hypothetical protein